MIQDHACRRPAHGTDVVASACPACGHNTLAHPGHINPALRACVLCELELLRDGLAAALDRLEEGPPVTHDPPPPTDPLTDPPPVVTAAELNRLAWLRRHRTWYDAGGAASAASFLVDLVDRLLAELARVTAPEPDCTCVELRVGLERTGARDWRAGCPAHGVSSRWYADVGRELFAARVEASRDLQRRARDARRASRDDPPDPGTTAR